MAAAVDRDTGLSETQNYLNAAETLTDESDDCLDRGVLPADEDAAAAFSPPSALIFAVASNDDPPAAVDATTAVPARKSAHTVFFFFPEVVVFAIRNSDGFAAGTDMIDAWAYISCSQRLIQLKLSVSTPLLTNTRRSTRFQLRVKWTMSGEPRLEWHNPCTAPIACLGVLHAVMIRSSNRR